MYISCGLNILSEVVVYQNLILNFLVLKSTQEIT